MKNPLEYTLAEIQGLIATDPLGIVNHDDMQNIVEQCVLFIKGQQYWLQKYRVEKELAQIQAPKEPSKRRERVTILQTRKAQTEALENSFCALVDD